MTDIQPMIQPKPLHEAQSSAEGGFTLIELSIVLVIIGLIVGGVLVGQDLIKAAELRAQLTQLEKYDATLNTFRTKYNGLPGDLASANATTFGLATRTGADARGDGDGVIEGAATTTGTAYDPCGETSLVWNDLSAANLLEGGTLSGTDGGGTSCHSTATVANVLPAAKIGGYLTIYAENGFNHYQIGNISALANSGVATTAAALTNGEAYQIDTKRDDGLPGSGNVRARVGTVLGSTTYVDDACVDTTPNPDTYSITSTDITSLECQISVRASN